MSIKNRNIKFGTDGWRAIIAKDFTFENLSIVTRATAKWIKEEKIGSTGVVIGHDARFMGREFSEHVAAVFATEGVKVKMANNITTTPAVSMAALDYDAVGIVITASHNPPAYNGFKIKAPFGGPASPDQIDAVEKHYEELPEGYTVKSYAAAKEEGMVEEFGLTDLFIKLLEKNLDLDAIRKSGIKIAHDPMYGASQGLVRRLLGDKMVHELHDELNPSFHGQAPEPIDKNLQELSAYIKANGCDVGIANDGDADRIGMYDENGLFVNSHQMLCLLTKYLSQEKGMTGDIVKTFSATDMLNLQAEKYGLKIHVKPIGFKYVAELIVSGDVLVGGEESGGLSVKGHIPERDGLYIGLLITEMMVKSGKTLSALVKELNDEFGVHATYREDMHTTDHRKNSMMEMCKRKGFTEAAGKKVASWDMLDGVKHIFEDGSWLLVRPSGTEPVLRIYSESRSDKEALDIVKDAVAKVNSF